VTDRLRPVESWTVKRTVLTPLLTLVTTAALWLSLAATAMARDGGEGVYGKTNDKVVTNFGFALIIFFPLLVLTLSLIQSWLTKRKQH
jgi:hypothetical protein